MDTFAEIADERRGLAALVSGLTRERLSNADALLLPITGRTIALDHLSGDGVPALRPPQRLASQDDSEQTAQGSGVRWA